MKTLRKTPDFTWCSAKRKRGTSIPLPLLSAHQGDTSVFLSLVCIIMASQRALLVVYLVSLVYVRSAKCLGREEVMLGWGGGGGGTPQSAQPWSFLIFTVTGFKLCPKPPPQGRAEPGKNNLLFDQVFKIKKERKETASLSADSLFNQLHKKCTEKIRTYCTDICDQHS